MGSWLEAVAGKTQPLSVKHFAPPHVLPQADMAKLGWRSLLVLLNWHLAQCLNGCYWTGFAPAFFSILNFLYSSIMPSPARELLIRRRVNSGHGWN
jgi:hypothetical protein